MTPFEVFQAALELATEQEQDAFVESQSDLAVQAEVRSLLNALRRAGGFLGGSQSRTNRSQESGERSVSNRVSGPEAELALVRLKQLLGESPDANAIGLLGHYSLQEILGIGGYGIVLRAFDEKLRRLVALKILIPKSGTASPHARFLEEARSAAAIKHENVVQVYSVEEQPIPYIVMEYVNGPTLHEYLIQESPMDIETLVRLSRQIASGLAASHERGFVHRDIKPGNILLEKKDDERRVKLMDFGLAQTIDDVNLSSSGDFIGTPSFTSPEQARSVEIDARSDLFSLGSVMYQMACGHPPFRAKSTHEVLQRVLNDTPRPIQDIRPSVPDWFCQVVEQLHVKNPEDRIQSASQLAKLLLDCESDIESAQRTVEQSTLVFPNRFASSKGSPSESVANDVTQKVPLAALHQGTSANVSRSARNRPLWVAAFAVTSGVLTWLILASALGWLRFDAMKGSSPRIANEDVSKSPPLSKPKLPVWDTQSLPPWSFPADSPLPLTIPATAQTATARQSEWADHLRIPTVAPTSTGLAFALVPPGEFDKTYTRTRDGVILPWMPTIRYRITRPFRMAVTEVTVGQFREFVEETGYVTDAEKLGLGCNTGVDLEPYLTWSKPGWQVKPTEPVTMVTDTDASAFCDWLSKKENRRFRLPRESEWIHACRAGSDSRFVVGQDHSGLDATAWTRENIGNTPGLVGSLAANPLGIYDMLGNVWERSMDWMEHHAMIHYTQRIDPTGLPMSNTLGSCFLESRHLTHTDVMVGNWSTPAASIGFRVMEEIDPSHEWNWKEASYAVADGSALSPFALTSAPKKIEGLTSWSVCLAGMQSDQPSAPVWNAKSNHWIVGGNDGGISVFGQAGDFQEKIFGPNNRTIVKISADCDWVVAKDSDGSVIQHLYVWYWPERKLKAILPTDGRYWSISPDSSKIAFSKLNKGPWNNWGVYEFDLEKGVTRSLLVPRLVDAYEWYPQGNRILCQTWSPQAALEIFEYPSMKKIAVEQTTRAYELSISPDGRRIAIPDPSNDVVRIRDAKTLQVTQVVSIPPECETVNCQWFSDGDRLFLAGANPARVVNVSTGEELFQLQPTKAFLAPPHLCEELGVVIGPEASNRMLVFSAKNGQLQGEWHSLQLPQHSAPVLAGDHIYLGSAQGIREFGLSESRPVNLESPSLQGPWGIDNVQSKIAALDRNKLRQYDFVQHSERSIEFSGLEDATLSRLVYSPDGSKIASVFRDQSGATQILIHDVASGKIDHVLKHERSESDVSSLIWSPDGTLIAMLIQSAATDLVIFDLSQSTNGECSPMSVAKISALVNEPNTEHRLRFCRNGAAVIVATLASFYEFDLQSKTLKTITSPRITNRVRSVFGRSDDSQFLLTHGGQIHYLCDSDFSLFSSEIRCPTKQAFWSPDNDTLFMHHPMFGLRIFEADSFQPPTALIPFVGKDHWVVCSSDGHYRGSEGAESVIAYVAMHTDGSQRTYSPQEFAKVFNWSNDPSSVTLSPSKSD